MRVGKALYNQIDTLKLGASNQLVFRRGALLRRRFARKAGPTAIVQIQDGTFHRYVYPFVKCLDLCGYQVSVEMSSSAVFTADVYVRLMLREGFISRIVASQNIPSSLTLSDDRGVRRLVISPDYFDDAIRCKVPMPMHPFMYSKGIIKEVATLGTRGSRPIRMLYAGSRGSSHPRLTQFFDVIPREDVLSHLFESSCVRPQILQAGVDLDACNADLLLCVRELCDVPQEILLRVMSSASFFLALPGWVMPMSHNLTECMSAGSIPILQYASCLAHPLTPEVNCLAFGSLIELDHVMRRALSMPESEIARLRKNVLRHYDEFLSPAAVVKNIRLCETGLMALMTEQVSVTRPFDLSS